MKYLVVLFLFNSMMSISQIWKEPFDTIAYYDRTTRLDKNKSDVKSYTVSQFDSSGTAVLFDYYEFNEEGYQIKSCLGISADQELDTVQYYYDENGVFQEAVRSVNIRKNTTRKFIKDSLNRTVAIIGKNDSSSWTTNYYYSNSGKLDSIVFGNGRTKLFEYNSDGQLSMKKIIDNGKLKEYFNYYFPEKNVTTYCDCHLIKVYDETIAACDSTIGTFNKRGDLSRLEEYFYMDSLPHYVTFKYDRKGRISKMSYKEPTGDASTVYVRNRRGLLTRIEHRDELERVYNYSEFVYEFR